MGRHLLIMRGSCTAHAASVLYRGASELRADCAIDEAGESAAGERNGGEFREAECTVYVAECVYFSTVSLRPPCYTAHASLGST